MKMEISINIQYEPTIQIIKLCITENSMVQGRSQIEYYRLLSTWFEIGSKKAHCY